MTKENSNCRTAIGNSLIGCAELLDFFSFSSKNKLHWCHRNKTKEIKKKKNVKVLE